MRATPYVPTRAERPVPREIFADGRPWIVGYEPGDDAADRPAMLLYVPADGPVGARPLRACAVGPFASLSDEDLAELRQAAR